MSRERENNSNWRGGRFITEHGYVLIIVGMKHHLADPRGYAYEHRIVAEKKLKRRLKSGEMVHHLNGDKQNNDPSNLIVVSSIREHQYYHRSPSSKLQTPGEPNLVVTCACGCGAKFKKYDRERRPRRFVSGHNMYRKKCNEQN